MHIIFHRRFRDLGRRLKQWCDIDIKSHVSEGGGDHFSAAIVPVLAHLRYHQPRSASFANGKIFRALANRADCLRLAEFAAVDTANGGYRRLVPAPDLLQRLRNLPVGGAGARRVDGKSQ